jgi:hypothetical protein
MHKSARLGLIAFAISMVVAITASPAVAAISIDSGGGSIAATSPELTLLTEEGLIIPVFTCSATFTGDLTTAAVEPGSLIGEFDAASFGACSGSSDEPAFGTPFSASIRLNSFSLVTSTHAHIGMTLEGVLLRVRSWEIECVWLGPLTVSMEADGSPLRATEFATFGLRMIDIGGSFLCPPRAGLSGTFSISPTLTLTLS